MSAKSVQEFISNGRSEKLVVLLHAYTSEPERLRLVHARITEEVPDADIYTPKLPAATFSFADPITVVLGLLDRIDALWEERKRQTGAPYHGVIFVGHSLGALISRKIYIYACGETGKAPFEADAGNQQQREWAGKVERIVLLAGMNRGWSINYHMSLPRAVVTSMGATVGHLCLLLGKRLLIFTIRKGSSFLTNLRIQWLAMRQTARDSGVGHAATIQLLGSIDDVVSPDDNVDLVSGADFYYLDVPFSGHLSIIDMDDTPAGLARTQVFRQALTAPVQELEQTRVTPHDLPLQERDADVSDVIFVVHGIRDLGYWTSKIARHVQKLGRTRNRRYVTKTSTYGYFPMLSFILPWKRRAKVEWLMDQYAEALALYPNAAFSYVGHSNGTYLLAKALRDYPCCRFKNVVFAGSVVRTDYKWRSVLESGKVQGVLNYVATADWVVALFPKALQYFGADLGSAGHDGFKEAAPGSGSEQVRYVKGRHSAALDERNWDAIAEFIIDGKPQDSPSSLRKLKRSRLLVFCGAISPLLWLGTISSIGWLTKRIIKAPWEQWQKVSAVTTLYTALFKILTRF